MLLLYQCSAISSLQAVTKMLVGHNMAKCTTVKDLDTQRSIGLRGEIR